jgi:hypothetical protein
MSDDDTPLAFIRMDGSLVLINMLMGALRRQAILSLGGTLDASGMATKDSEPIAMKEIHGLMVILAAQGFNDVMCTGFLSLETAKYFTGNVADELERQRSRSRG